MARSNKYTSLNLNDVFDKKLTNNNNNKNTNHPATTTNNNPSAKSFSNHTKTALSNSRIHGHMLVLTRPTPKPISVPHINDKASSLSSPSAPDRSKPTSEPGSISLRPLGSTGSGPPLTSHPLPSPVSPSPSPSPIKSDRFVPPHLRPGFVGKEEKPGPPELGKGGAGSFKGKVEIRGQRPVQPQGLDPIEGRPKSGGGYEPVRKGRDLTDLKRPVSSGTRPSSSG